MALSKQMELFEDGGLKDEGGTVDEVSGNDVPTGSTREEVRDDIPAQLSEGEFVLPADVVRYHGLEKIMELRDEAKQGLQKMEAMGQMGNSEEAILPDDVPFDMDDLDIEDDEPQEMEMAEGGYVMVGGKPMPVPTVAGKPLNMQVGGFTNPTGTYQVPTNIATQPSYFANYRQTVAPFQPFTPSQTFQPKPVEAGQKQSYIPFNQLIPTVNARRETFEYRNAAGQKLFIPFVNGQPIYPIPEGYRRYTEEQQTKTEQAPVTGTTTQVTGDGSDDVLSQTSQVRGLDNSIVDTNFAGKSTEQVSKSMANMSVADRGKAVMNALDQAKGTTGLARGLQQLGAVAVPGALTAGMIGQKTLDPRNVLSQVGIPDTKNLNSLLNAFGPSTVGLSPEEIDMQGIDRNEALSQAMYGMSYEAATRALGVAPTFTKGYKNGQVDPTTGATYAYGQATDDDGNVSYGSIDDFGIGMGAMSATGFMGSLADVDRVVNSPTATKEQKEAAKKYERIVTMKSKYGKDIDIDTISGKSFGDDSGPGPGDGGGATGDPDDDDSAATDVTSSSVAGPGNVSQSTDPDINSDDSDGVEAGPDNSSGAGVESGVSDFQIGGLAGKRKPKPKTKKMKRGGLASKK